MAYPKVKVIISQSAKGRAHEIRCEMIGAGFNEYDDFITCSYPEDVEEFFLVDGRQLLIVGSVGGSESNTIAFVTAAREKNPKLVVWFYSVFDAAHPDAYDRVIGKGDIRVPDLVREYLSNP